MIFFCVINKRLWLWWLAYIYFEMVPFTTFMNLLCYSLGTFKYFYECGYYGGFICKIVKWRCGYLHIHYRLFIPSIFIGTCPFMNSPQLTKKLFHWTTIIQKTPPQWVCHSLKAQTLGCIINVFWAQLLDISWKDLALEKHLSYFQTLNSYCTNPFTTSTTSWVIVFHGNTHLNYMTNLLPCRPT